MMHLKQHTEVEVTSNDDGFRGVWYVGKILNPPKKSDNDFVLVEYNDLVSEQDQSKKLSEKVHVSLVRPLPPPKLNDDVIQVNDVVDVFYMDGWWVGVVEEIVGEDEFGVCFDDPPDKMVVKRLDVRVHLDWVHGKWERPIKKNNTNKEDSSRPDMASYRFGYSRRQKTSAEKQKAGKSCASTDKKATCLHAEMIEKECNAEKVDMFVNEVNGVPAKNCKTPLKKDQKYKSMDQKKLTVDDSSRLSMLSNQSGNSRNRGRISTPQAEKRFVSIEKKDNTGVHVDIVEKECITEVVKDALSAKVCETSQKKDQKKQSMDQEMTTVDSTNGSTQVDVSSKRKRGKQIGNGSLKAKRSLRKRIRDDSCVGNEAKINAESDRLMHITVDDKSNENHFQPSSNDNMKVTADKKHTSAIQRHSDLLSKTAIPLPEDQSGETVPSKRVRDEGMIKLVDKCQNTSQGNTSSPVIYHVKDVDMLMNGNLGVVNDDQVGNTSLQADKPSPTSSDASRTLPVQSQCANANGRQDDGGQDDIGTPPVAKKDRIHNTDGPELSSPLGDFPVKNLNQADKNGELGTPASVTIDNMENGQSLPFIKCSPLWEILESIEIYKRTAQKPHFSPLVKCSEDTREGLAIAHMVNFSNLVEKTTKLQFSHPITVIQSSLETLAELESNGFDVETVRGCLTQLLSKRQTGDELQKEYQDIENEILNNFNEKEKVDEEVTQLTQKMNELAEKLGDAVSRKEVKERAISTLKAKQDAVSKNVEELQLDFQNITGSLC